LLQRNHGEPYGENERGVPGSPSAFAGVDQPSYQRNQARIAGLCIKYLSESKIAALVTMSTVNPAKPVTPIKSKGSFTTMNAGPAVPFNEPCIISAEIDLLILANW